LLPGLRHKVNPPPPILLSLCNHPTREESILYRIHVVSCSLVNCSKAPSSRMSGPPSCRCPISPNV
jgi:hypothetical protein